MEPRARRGGRRPPGLRRLPAGRGVASRVEAASATDEYERLAGEVAGRPVASASSTARCARPRRRRRWTRFRRGDVARAGGHHRDRGRASTSPTRRSWSSRTPTASASPSSTSCGGGSVARRPPELRAASWSARTEDADAAERLDALEAHHRRLRAGRGRPRAPRRGDDPRDPPEGPERPQAGVPRAATETSSTRPARWPRRSPSDDPDARGPPAAGRRDPPLPRRGGGRVPLQELIRAQGERRSASAWSSPGPVLSEFSTDPHWRAIARATPQALRRGRRIVRGFTASFPDGTGPPPRGGHRRPRRPPRPPLVGSLSRWRR